MRDQFEKLPEIATHLSHGNVFFNEEKKAYASEFSSLHIVACYVNGAWMAFQEQQKKIDAVLRFVDGYDSIDIENSVNLRDCVNEVQELLK